MQREVIVETLQAAITQAAGATSTTTLKINAARFLEIWLNVTAVSGTNGPSLTLNIETSIDGTNFVTIGSITAITAESTNNLTLPRQDFPLGTQVRVSWTISGTTPSFTFDVKAGQME